MSGASGASGAGGASGRDTGARSYRIRFFVEDDELIGARWWNEAFRARAGVRRRNLVLWVGGGGALALGVVPAVLRALIDDDDDDMESAVDALELQRQRGWNVGQEGARLTVAGASAVDTDGGGDWRMHLPLLAEALAPASPSLRPYFVPTLFQSVAPAAPGSAALREALAPVHTPEMDVAFDKGAALGGLLREVGTPPTVAVVLDLPGPEAVAAAAALAPQMTPVFGFDNWPHPLGVVPAQQTLGAALYHAPALLRAAQSRPAVAPPLFVLDDARLSPYRDDATQFDNRYVARLPSAASLAGLKVSRLLYVLPAGAAPQELDDLNDDLVAYRDGGIDVRLLSFGDLEAGDVVVPDAGAAVRPATTATTYHRHYYWGGSPMAHHDFWWSYGWYRPAPQPPPGRRPAAPASVAYRPAARSTIFSSRSIGGAAGVGKQKPSGFGRVSVRTSRATGALTGVAAGRSGSFGRSRSSWSG